MSDHKKDKYGFKNDPTQIQEPLNYYRQYFAYKNEKGQKVIYFNCFTKNSYKNDDTWKKEEIIVMDGGNNYFSIVINLELQDCSLFTVHGIA